MNPIRLRITSVDHNGYNGRDYPPADSDIGQIVTVVKVETYRVDSSGEDFDELQNGDPLPSPEETAQCFTVRTRDNRTLELMDHEVEPVSEPSFIVYRPSTPDTPRLYYRGDHLWTESRGDAKWWSGERASALCEILFDRFPNVAFAKESQS